MAITNVILEIIKEKEELALLSKAYKKGEIKLNKTQLAQKLNVDRKTVSKYLNGEIPKKNRNRSKYLDTYKDAIKEVLNDDNRVFDYVDHLYRFMKREYKIKCNRVTFNRYIRSDIDLSNLFKKNSTEAFTVRFETEPGQQIQFDLKEKVLLVTKTGIKYRVYIPTITFGWSRYNYRKLVLDTKTDTLLAFLAEAFEDFRGVPKEIVIDNLKAFVDISRRNGEEALLNPAFEQFCKDYNIKVKPCMPRRPKTKGKTETQNKVIDQLKNYSGYYNDIDDMHDMVDIINNEDNEAISQATKLPRIFLYNKEER